MTITALRLGDVIQCDVRGYIFYAIVDSKPDADGVSIQPIGRATYYHVEARDVIGHWKKAGRR